MPVMLMKSVASSLKLSFPTSFVDFYVNGPHIRFVWIFLKFGNFVEVNFKAPGVKATQVLKPYKYMYIS